jgi:RNA polymerase sigma-70 factor (ECF subfamily)
MNASAWIRPAIQPIWALHLMDCPPNIEPPNDAPAEPGQASPDADALLLRRIAAGESTALGLFYEAHANALFGLALRILNDHKEAEDVLQEVFLQVWNKASAYDPALGRPLSWVITLTRNKAIDRLRSAQRRSRLFEEAGEELSQHTVAPMITGIDALEAGEQANLVCAALQRLPAEQKRAIELAFFLGLTQTEIAAALNEPLGTVKARIRRGMLKLREELDSGTRPEPKPRPPVEGRVLE